MTDAPGTAVYRERHRLRRPPELVADRLDRQLGGPVETDADATDGDADHRWRYSALAGLYDYDVALDARAGELAVTVVVPGWYRLASATALPAAAVLVAVPLSARVVGALLWGYALLALVPVAHLLPWVPAKRPAPGTAAEAVQRRLAPTAVPPYLAVVAALWAAFHGAGRTAGGSVAVVALLAVGLGAYAVGGALPGGRRRARGTGGERSTAPGVPTVGIPLSALLAPVVAGGNVLLAQSALSGGAGPGALAVALAVALALDATYFHYCRIARHGFARARVVALRSRSARGLALGAHLAANVTLAAAAVVGAAVVAGWVLGGSHLPAPLRPPATLAAVPALRWAPAGARTVLAAAASAVLVAPVLVTGLGWTHKVVTDGYVATAVLRSSRPTEPPAALRAAGLDVPVRVADVGAPVLRPVRLPLVTSFVVVDEAVAAGLADDELAAAVAHEAYHLRADPSLTVLGTLAGVVLGGRNALLAFVDYPGLERAADDFAAERIGTAPLVRALRRMEGLRLQHGTAARWRRVVEGTPADDGPAGETRPERAGPLAGARALVLAPYRLLFGPVLQDAAHDDVDERIARLVGESSRHAS